MAKSARGLPASFTLDVPEQSPVQLGDFLDEPPPVLVAPKRQEPQVAQPFRPEIVPDRKKEEQVRQVQAAAKASTVIRCQLNLTHQSKTMLEEVVEHVRTYSPESDARTSEVFQGIIGLLHNALGELYLAELPRRGAWGSVTARNFPGALGEIFERAIVREAKKRGAG